MSRITTILMTILILGLSFLAGCTGTARKGSEIGWPPPPQKPKIIYEGSIYGSQNLPRSFWQKIEDFLFGGSQDLDINKPYGITMDKKGRLYIADTGKKGILIFDFKSGRIDLVNSLGSYGYLGEPVNIILDDNGNMYVGDTRLGKIVVFDKDRKFSHFIGTDSLLKSPVGMAVSKQHNRLYVVDAQQHKVFILSLDGRYIGEFGGRGDDKGQFHFPLGITIDKDTIYIVDSFHFAVQAFDIDGRFLFSFGPNGAGISPMARPRDIAVDSEGHLYITDALKHNVQIYDKKGQLLLAFGSAGLYPGQFRLPAGIYISSDDTIWIADSVNRRIQKFAYVGDN